MSLLVAALLCLAQAAPSPSPSPSPSASPSAPASGQPRRLRLDIEKHVDDVMARDKDGRPRFEESIDVLARAPDEALAQMLQEFDLECGPSSGPPTAVESREFRPHMSPSLDVSALLTRLLAGAVTKPNGPPRYFLYRVQAPGGADYLLREGRLTVPPGQQPTTAFELVEGFPDLASAVRGFQRMERGFADPVSKDAARPPDWSSSPCRLRPRR